MKIVQVIPDLAKGGAERLVLDICHELQQRPGISVKLVTFQGTNEFPFLSKNLDHRVITTDLRLSLFKKNVVRNREWLFFLDEFKPDIIHTHLFSAELKTRLLPYRPSTYFTHLHDNMPQIQRFDGRSFSKVAVTNAYERYLLVKAYQQLNNRFIAISQDTKDYFLQNLPRQLHPNITLLHNAINYNAFSHPVKNRQEYQLIKLVSIGSLVPKKNHQFLIEVVKELNKLGGMVQLDILGKGPLKNDLVVKIAEADLEGQIRLHGAVDDVQSFLREADIYVHPANYEPFGLVILEAMAAGLPVVTLDGRGNRDIIQHEVNGYLFEQQDASAFAMAIISLMNDQQLYERIALAGQQFAADYDMKPYTDRLLALYESVL